MRGGVRAAKERALEACAKGLNNAGAIPASRIGWLPERSKGRDSKPRAIEHNTGSSNLSPPINIILYSYRPNDMVWIGKNRHVM